MPSIGQPFKREGVPRSQEALAALGVDVKGDKGSKGLDREREGAKGLDDIRLSAAERAEAEFNEVMWSEEELIVWFEQLKASADGASNFLIMHGRKVFRDVFDIVHGHIVCREDTLRLSRSGVKELPPGLKVNSLNLSYTEFITKLPPRLEVGSLGLFQSRISEIPSDAKIGKVILSEDQVNLRAQAVQMNIPIEFY